MGDIFSFMDPGDKKSETFFVTRFGRPVPDYHLSIVITPMHTQIPCSELNATETSQERCNCAKDMTTAERKTALEGLKVNSKSRQHIYTDENGEATITLTAGHPGNIRKHVDGMVYLVTYLPCDWIDNGYSDGPLVVRVFDAFVWEGEPVWYGKTGIQPVFKQYENLYPSMRNIVNLGDYHSLAKRHTINHLKASMSAPKTAADYMPVTRDLSINKSQMILQWLNQPFPPAKGFKDDLDLEELKYALQLALQVEFYTIPPYAYALYSIKEGANRQIAELLKGILVEEMSHLATVANILNAIGGCPRIWDPDFIPVFPSRLPGGVEPDVIVRLAPLSIDLVRDVFMRIETPTQTAIDSDADDIHNDTLGTFYKKIWLNMFRLEKESQKTNNTIFTGDHAKQVNYTTKPVYNLADAKEGIITIVEQGEGTSQTNPTASRDELAHYYKFAEIVYGKELCKTSNDTWDYVGPPVPFDQNGVWPLQISPKVTDYPVGSRARALAEDFRTLYWDTLARLQIAFNGQPQELSSAVANMFLLKMKAREMAKVEVKPGVHAGPTFENSILLHREGET
jgi:rubrerythrin